MFKILKIKNESGKKMNQKEGAVLFVSISVNWYAFFFLFFWYES